MCRVCMGRVCYVPSLLWAEFVMCRVDPIPPAAFYKSQHWPHRRCRYYRHLKALSLCSGVENRTDTGIYTRVSLGARTGWRIPVRFFPHNLLYVKKLYLFCKCKLINKSFNFLSQ